MSSGEVDMRATLSLPRTPFTARVDMPPLEAELLRRWEEQQLYRAIIDKNRERPCYRLPDGPPDAGGRSHLGASLNKLLQDLIVRVRNMSGYRAELAPGWRCHGLQIEPRVERELDDAGRSATELRAACRAFALSRVNAQRQAFRRLGILADWEAGYLTMDGTYAAAVLRELQRFLGAGLYRGPWPVRWCPGCGRALEVFELETRTAQVPSVCLTLTVETGAQLVDGAGGRALELAIWTTAPWTLPGAEAIAFSPRLRYRAYPQGERLLLLAEACRDALVRATGLELDEERALELDPALLPVLRCTHPLRQGESLPLVPDSLVRSQLGTGLLHVSPGHQRHDLLVARDLGLPLSCVTDDSGRYTAEAGAMAGRALEGADDEIVELLLRRGHLLTPRCTSVPRERPRCARCGAGVCRRLREQWLLSLDHHNLRARTLEALDRVRWTPPSGRKRLAHGLKDQRVWRLSRDRAWGLPIPALRCLTCGATHLDHDLLEHAADLIEHHGVDAWSERPDQERAPPGYRCARCDGASFKPEPVVVDPRFEAGVSFAAVCEARGAQLPADLYVEGSDQHQGWFRAALLSAVATRRTLPFKQVLCRGFALDRAGRRLAEYDQERAAPARLVGSHGAELMRLWVCSQDVTSDMVLTPGLLARVAGQQRRLRSTLRFALGNLADFVPAQHVLADAALREIDRYLLARLGRLVKLVREDYERHAFHRALQRALSFAARDLSAFYYELSKDWLYCDPGVSHRRRSAQTALYRLLRGLLSLLAPMLPFSCEEAHDHLPEDVTRSRSIHLTDLPVAAPLLALDDDGLVERFDRLRLYRAEVTRALEAFRARGHHPRQACLVIAGSFEVRDFLQRFDDLEALLGVSQVTLVETRAAEGLTESRHMPGFAIGVERALGQTCVRCRRVIDTGELELTPPLCHRCATLLATA